MTTTFRVLRPNECNSELKDGIDRSEKWQRPFQMATTVYEREIGLASIETRSSQIRKITPIVSDFLKKGRDLDNRKFEYFGVSAFTRKEVANLLYFKVGCTHSHCSDGHRDVRGSCCHLPLGRWILRLRSTKGLSVHFSSLELDLLSEEQRLKNKKKKKKTTS